MFILIKDNTYIKPYILNNNVEYKGIHIYKNNNNYYIELKNGYYFSDNEKIKQLQITKYEIKQEKVFYSIYIYVYDNDSGYKDFKLYRNSNFLIANNTKANIEPFDEYLNNFYLVCKQGILTSNSDIIVNHRIYDGEKLKQGDLIEYLGIKIVYFDEFLYINNFRNTSRLNPFESIGYKIKYKNIENNDAYYIPNDIYDFNIDELKEYVLPKKTNNIDFIKSLIPNFIMCITMCVMAFINYSSSLKNGDTNILSFIVMPISMLFTSVIIPSIFIFITNWNYKRECNGTKQEYIEYLNKYEHNLDVDVSKYIESLNSRFFDVLNSKKMTFYAGKNTDEYMKLSIGHISTSKDLKVKYTGDKEIDDFIKRIENKANNISNYPLFLNIKENKRITIISKAIEKDYYFNIFLLETVYKHHYDDVHIAIYSKNESLFNNVFNLPHLFIHNKRLTLSREEQLQELDQIKLEKPLILFLYDKCNYIFNNENIYLIYFSNETSDIYKDSNAIIKYIDSNGSLFTDYNQIFKYNRKDINFNNYFAYLGKLKKISNNNAYYTFKNIFKNNIKDYYSTNGHSLKATFAYSNNELISLDLHESKQGPHGLIGGSTGSGKSELIVSLLLSLCIRYSPEYLNIVLIDYKGGGLKESLSFNGVNIPHIVASISNLENNSLERLIIALHNECKRRQLLFKKLSSYASTSIMNLDDYIEANSFNLDKIAHLLIVVDEFAELKKENPEQIKELISISRIGRSLGIHLILATQKPAGVIDDEIWSNSRFKIALKVFDEKDSVDIIKCKDAAYLNNPGSFIMHIDGSLIKAKSIYAKNDVNGNDSYKVSLLNSELITEKTYKTNNTNQISNAMYFAKKIIDASKDYKIHKINFLPPNEKDRHSLANGDCIVMGEIDDYINSNKDLLAYDIKESILIYSTRKYEINSILNTLNERERHTVVIGSRIYTGKYISDSIFYDDSDDIEFLLKALYRNKNNNLTLVVEDISSLLSYDEIYNELFYKLIKRKDAINVSLIFITSTTQLSFKIINAFRNKVLININDYSDLSSFYGMRSIYKGNSYYFSEKPITFIPIKLEQYNESNQKLSNIIKHIPEFIEADLTNNKILIGYDEETKEPIYTSKDICLVSLDQELLNAYISSYKDIKTYLYNYKTVFEENASILWLGPGIFNQRLFITGRKEDININQGIFIKNSRSILIRRINNVWKINEI